MTETEGPVLLTDVTDRVGTITLNRPARRNALNGELVAALDAAVRAMAADDEVRVVVLTGAPAPGAAGGFCSGGDTKEGRGSPGMELAVPPDALGGDLRRHDSHAAVLLHRMPKPTIAMVGGPAVGAGCALAASCDLRFASEDAVFSAGFLPNGLTGDYGGTLWWTRIAGTATARRLYLMNEKIPAAQALALGMVHEVHPPEALAPRVREVAGQLARSPRELLALVKDNLNQAEDDDDRRRYLFASEAHHQVEAGRQMLERMRRAADRKQAGG